MESLGLTIIQGGSSTLSSVHEGLRPTHTGGGNLIASSYDENEQRNYEQRLNSGRSFMIVGSSAFDHKGQDGRLVIQQDLGTPRPLQQTSYKISSNKIEEGPGQVQKMALLTQREIVNDEQRAAQNYSPNKPPRVSIINIRQSEQQFAQSFGQMTVPPSPLQPQNFTLIRETTKNYSGRSQVRNARHRSNSHSPEKFSSRILNKRNDSERILSSIPDSQEFKRWKDDEEPQHSIYEQQLREDEDLDKIIKHSKMVVMRGKAEGLIEADLDVPVVQKLPDIPDRQTQDKFIKQRTIKKQTSKKSIMHLPSHAPILSILEKPVTTKKLTFQQQFFGDPEQYSRAKPLSPHKAALRQNSKAIVAAAINQWQQRKNSIPLPLTSPTSYLAAPSAMRKRKSHERNSESPLSSHQMQPAQQTVSRQQMHVTIETKVANYHDTVLASTVTTSLNSTNKRRKFNMPQKRKHGPFKAAKRLKNSKSTETIEMKGERDQETQDSSPVKKQDQQEDRSDSPLGFKRLPGADSTKALLKISNQESSREALMLNELDQKKRNISSQIDGILMEDSRQIAKDILKNHHFSTSDVGSTRRRQVHSTGRTKQTPEQSVLTDTGQNEDFMSPKQVSSQATLHQELQEARIRDLINGSSTKNVRLCRQTQLSNSDENSQSESPRQSFAAVQQHAEQAAYEAAAAQGLKIFPVDQLENQSHVKMGTIIKNHHAKTLAHSPSPLPGILENRKQSIQELAPNRYLQNVASIQRLLAESQLSKDFSPAPRSPIGSSMASSILMKGIYNNQNEKKKKKVNKFAGRHRSLFVPMNGVYSSRVLLQNPDIAQSKDIHFYLDGQVSPPKKSPIQIETTQQSLEPQPPQHNLDLLAIQTQKLLKDYGQTLAQSSRNDGKSFVKTDNTTNQNSIIKQLAEFNSIPDNPYMSTRLMKLLQNAISPMQNAGVEAGFRSQDLIPAPEPPAVQIIAKRVGSGVRAANNPQVDDGEYLGFSIRDHITEQVQLIKQQQMLQQQIKTPLPTVKRPLNNVSKISVKKRAASIARQEPLFTGPNNHPLSPRLILKPLADMSELEVILSQTKRNGPQNLRFKNPQPRSSLAGAFMEGLGVSSGLVSRRVDEALRIKDGKLYVKSDSKLKFKNPYAYEMWQSQHQQKHALS